MLAMAVWAIEANFISMVERRLESCSFRFISLSILKLRSRSTLSSWVTFFRSSLEVFLSSFWSICWVTESIWSSTRFSRTMRIISIFSSMLRLLSLRMSLIEGSRLRLLEDLPLLLEDLVVPLLPPVLAGFGLAVFDVVGFGVALPRRASSLPNARWLRDIPETPEPLERDRRSRTLGWSRTYRRARFREGEVSALPAARSSSSRLRTLSPKNGFRS